MHPFADASWLIPALPALAFFVIAVFSRRQGHFSAWLSILSMAVCFILSVGIFIEFLGFDPAHRVLTCHWTWLQVGNWQANIGLLLDPLSVNMLLVVTFVSLLVQVYSLGYMHGDERLAVFYSYLSLFTASMLGLVLSDNYLQIYIFWELVGLCSYLLVGFWYFKPEAAEASKKAFVVNRIGDMGFLIGVVTIGMTFQTFDFSQVQQLIGQSLNAGTYKTGYIAGIAILLFCGAMGKSAQFPLHVWLPDAMEGPTPVSALIHAATMVAAGVFMVARTYSVFSADPLSMQVVAYIGGFTALFAATIAVAQDDIKRILAYSTLSQLGYMMLAMGVGGYTPGMFHLTTHACFKALLFLGAGSVIHATETNDIWKMGGLLKPMKVTAWTFLIGALAISGIPPFAGFWSKDEILSAVFNSPLPGHFILYGMASFAAFLTAFYMFRLFFVVFLGEKKEEAGHGHAAHESPQVMTVPLLILAVFSVGIGWVNLPGVDAYSQFVHYGDYHPEGFNILIATFSSVLALAGIGLASLFYWQKVFSAEKAAQTFRPIHLLLKNKYYFDEMYGWAVKHVVFGFASFCDWLDEKFLDGFIVDGSAGLARKLGSWLTKTQTGSVQNYALAVFGAVVLLYLLFSF